MVAIVQLKWYIADAYIFGIIISKHNHKQELDPIVLIEIDKSLKICLHNTVLPLYFTFCLRAKSGQEIILNLKKVAKQ